MFAYYIAFGQYPAKRHVGLWQLQRNQITEIHQGLVFLIYNYTGTVEKNEITNKKQRERTKRRKNPRVSQPNPSISLAHVFDENNLHGYVSSPPVLFPNLSREITIQYNLQSILNFFYFEFNWAAPVLFRLVLSMAKKFGHEYVQCHATPKHYLL